VGEDPVLDVGLGRAVVLEISHCDLLGFYRGESVNVDQGPGTTSYNGSHRFSEAQAADAGGPSVDGAGGHGDGGDAAGATHGTVLARIVTRMRR
jgi:hypothetical protein